VPHMTNSFKLKKLRILEVVCCPSKPSRSEDFHSCESGVHRLLCSPIHCFYFDWTGESLTLQQDRILSRQFGGKFCLLVSHGITQAIQMQQGNCIR
jgi:hypothetical protein